MDAIPGFLARLYTVHFREKAGAGEVALWEFDDPAPCVAAATVRPLTAAPPETATADLLILALVREAKDDSRARREARAWVEEGGDGTEVLSVKAEDVSAVWRAGRAAIVATADKLDAALQGLVEFAFYDRELGRLEQELAQGWTQVQADSRLACSVSRKNHGKHDDVSSRMAETLDRRFRQIRIEPWLFRPAEKLPPLARQVGEALREEADWEDRAEAVDGKLETCEYVYELAAQRLSDYRHARSSAVLEIWIVVILAVEMLVILLDVYLNWYLSE